MGTENHQTSAPATDRGWKYWAFLSYSRNDARIASKLHRQLETYSTPKDLVGTVSNHGFAVPNRLFPIFKDDSELRSGPSLSKAIEEALAASRCLIVVCTPQSANSKWVRAEVESFCSQGRREDIYLAIFGGEPGAPIWDGGCFVPALGSDEPLAADFRPGQGRYTAALCQLLAGVLGIQLDSLRNRERLRARGRRRNLVAATAVTLMAAATVGWFEYDRSDLSTYRSTLQTAGLSDGHDQVARFRAAVQNSESRSVVVWQDHHFVRWDRSLVAAPQLDNAWVVPDISMARSLVIGANSASTIGVVQLPSLNALIGDAEVSADESFDFGGPAIRLTPDVYFVGATIQSTYAGGAQPVVILIDLPSRVLHVIHNETAPTKKPASDATEDQMIFPEIDSVPDLGDGFYISPDCQSLAIKTDTHAGRQINLTKPNDDASRATVIIDNWLPLTDSGGDINMMLQVACPSRFWRPAGDAS
jgi:hypothetical protein